MILRFSQKLGARLKAGPLSPAPLDEAPVADWTSHIFFFDRAPYILVSNTAALYSVVLYAKGITNESMFITSFMTSLRDIMAADGLAAAYDRFITPHAGTIRLAGGFANHGEGARLVRGGDGRVSEVWVGGTKLLPETAIAAELTERYGG